MKVRIKVRGGGSTGLRNAQKFIDRGTARWVAADEIEMIESDYRFNCDAGLGGELTVSLRREQVTALKVEPSGRKDFGFPALPIIGYDRTTVRRSAPC